METAGTITTDKHRMLVLAALQPLDKPPGFSYKLVADFSDRQCCECGALINLALCWVSANVQQLFCIIW